MGFMKPKIPTPPPAPRPANPAIDPMSAEAFNLEAGMGSGAGSLINTSSRGLKRRAATQRTSLIGGSA